jgi:hypothetical protein
MTFLNVRLDIADEVMDDPENDAAIAHAFSLAAREALTARREDFDVDDATKARAVWGDDEDEVCDFCGFCGDPEAEFNPLYVGRLAE